ncbi:MAG: hypothetical protein M1576_00095 [Deltaproteobacteria bacterium]|jgi:hypothetical protein|nr:hypothetical protein [Deltaproteobacteria bacterium]
MVVNLINDITAIENIFSENSYKGKITDEKYFKIIEGHGNILISAPHSVTQWRNNNIKKADIYTGSIATILSQLTNFPAIIMTKFIENTKDYFNEIKNMVNSKGIKLVVDIHGMKYEKKSDIDIGIGSNFQFIPQQILDKMRGVLSNYCLNNTVNAYFNADNSLTVSYNVYNELNISSVQLEINRKFRDPIAHYDKFMQMINAISDSLKAISPYLN